MKKFFELTHEQWAGVLVLVAVAILAGFSTWQIEAGKAQQRSQVRGGQATALDPSFLNVWKTKIAGLSEPTRANDLGRFIFTSRPLVYVIETNEVIHITDDYKTPDGITVGWKRKFGFPIEDPTVADADPDHDGWTNLQEFTEGTNPVELASRPPLFRRLFVKNYRQVEVKIEFRGYSRNADGSFAFQINFRDRRSTQFHVKGDVVEGYKILDFNRQIVRELDPAIGVEVERDQSKLMVLDQFTQERLELVINKPTISDQSEVTFGVQVPDAADIGPIRRGGVFQLENHEYRVQRAGPETIIIRKDDPQKAYRVKSNPPPELEKISPSAHSVEPSALKINEEQAIVKT